MGYATVELQKQESTLHSYSNKPAVGENLAERSMLSLCQIDFDTAPVSLN